MNYLYGDATSSPLELNYIEFLRGAVDLAVAILQATGRIAQQRTEGDRHRRDADAAIDELHQLGRELVRVLEAPAGQGAKTPAGRCAASIARSANDIVAAEVTGVKSELSGRLREIEQRIDAERRACADALERMLLAHDIPQGRSELHIALAEGGRYNAQVKHHAPRLGLESAVQLKIPADHLLAGPLRVDRVVAQLEILAPERRGWLSKKVKLVPHKLTRKYLTQLTANSEQTTLKLRATPDPADTGFDVLYPAASDEVHVILVHRDSEALSPYAVSGADANRLREFEREVSRAARGVLRERESLVSATLDGKPMAQHPDPRVLVERLVELMAPTVREIANHSLQTGEFVLKRSMESGRREEIFVPKAELLERMAPLTPAQRAVFAPLGLADDDWEGADEAITQVADPPSRDLAGDVEEPPDAPTIDQALRALEADDAAAD